MAAPRVPNPAKGDAPRVKTNQAFLRLSRRLDALEAALADLGVDVEALEAAAGPSSLIHTEPFGFAVGAAGAYYVPFGSHQAESGTAGAIHVLQIPFAGTITGIHVLCTNDPGSTTATLRDTALNALSSDTQSGTSFTIGAVTDYEIDFTLAEVVAEDDKILLGLNFANNPGTVLGWIRLES